MVKENFKLKKFKKIHFIGIGGAGMSAIAHVLIKMGYKVAGSDIKESRYTKDLQKNGATIYLGHQKENINDSDIVVYSSAVPKNNVEVEEAKKRKIPLIPRAKMLSMLGENKKTISVAGTHGKTTTTSMISFLFKEAKLEPTFVIGGELNDIGSNAGFGSGEYFIAEADESDGSFLFLKSYISVVTNIEADHLEFYKTIDNLKNYFFKFLNNTSLNGFRILCGDNMQISELIKEKNIKEFYTYGLKEENDIRAENIRFNSEGSTFEVYYKGKYFGKGSLKLPGVHNVVNVLCAVLTGIIAGIKDDDIFEILSSFKGVKRRFELRGCFNGISFVDDYAHHPTEVGATLQAANHGEWGRIVCIFQPHRFSRTKFLGSVFGKSFGYADLLIVTDVYGAGEEPIPGVTGKNILDAVLKENPYKKVVYLPRLDEISNYLIPQLKDGDLVLTMGAGDITMLSNDLLSSLEQAGK